MRQAELVIALCLQKYAESYVGSLWVDTELIEAWWAAMEDWYLRDKGFVEILQEVRLSVKTASWEKVEEKM